MKWGLWSVVAGSNSATPPDGWPEGQAPSTVNDCAREMMAQIRTGLNNLQFVDLGVTPTETGNTTFTLAGNQMQWYPYGGRVQANVGGTLYTGTVISSTYTTNTGVTLRFDIGGSVLTNSLSAVATGYPAPGGALPEQVFRRKNFIINSQFDIWQRGAGPVSLSSNSQAYLADRWLVANHIASAGATVVVSRGERSANVSNVPTLAQAGVFLNNCLVVSCNAALAGVSATDNVFIRQSIEGFNWAQLAGKPLTLSFWVNSQVTGTYCVAIMNGGGTLAQVQQYSISSVATWEKKTINFVKSPLGTGTWDYSTGAGLQVTFTLMAGSALQGGAGNWTATNVIATSAQTNFMGTASKTFMLTGIQMEEGNYPSPIEPVIYDQEFAACQRYCQTISGYVPGASGGTNFVQGIVNLPVQMRSIASISSFPAVANIAVITYAGVSVSVSTVAQLFIPSPSQIGLTAFTTTPGLTANVPYIISIAAGSSLIVTAEL